MTLTLICAAVLTDFEAMNTGGGLSVMHLLCRHNSIDGVDIRVADRMHAADPQIS